MTVVRQPTSVLARLAARWGRSAVLITGSHVVAQLIGIFTALMLTRFFAPSQYGHYALALFYASMVTHIINGGLLQGTFMCVFGAGGDDDDDVDDSSDSLLITSAAFDRRRFLSSTLVLTGLISLAVIAISIVIAPALSRLLFGQPHSTDLVLFATISGALGALWRYAVNLLRVERRITAYCVCRTIRPLGALGAIAALVSTGGGLRGGLIGLSVGSVLSLVPTFAVSRHSYRAAVHPSDWAVAMRAGLVYIPITLFAGFVHGAGVYLLAGYRDASEVGRFSVASSIAAPSAHFVQGFLSSMSPMRRTSVYAAAEQDPGEMKRHVINVFLAATLLAYVAIALLAKELVRVIPSGYEGAAAIVPYTLLGWTGYGFYMIIYRLSSFPHRRAVYVTASALSAALYVGFSALLDPSFGGAGQGLAWGATYAVTAAVVLTLSQRGPEPLPFDGIRIVAMTLLAAGCVVGFLRLSDLVPSLRLLIALAGIATCVIAMIVTRVLPWSIVVSLWRVASGMVPRPGTATSVREGIEQLDPPQARVLMSLNDGRSPAELAAELGMSEREFELRAVAGMRELAGLGGPRACDMRIGEYLLSPKSMAERDVLARKLREEIDPGEIDMLETTARLVRQAARSGDARGRWPWRPALRSGRKQRALAAGEERPQLPERTGPAVP